MFNLKNFTIDELNKYFESTFNTTNNDTKISMLQEIFGERFEILGSKKPIKKPINEPVYTHKKYTHDQEMKLQSWLISSNNTWVKNYIYAQKIIEIMQLLKLDFNYVLKQLENDKKIYEILKIPLFKSHNGNP